jgi:hypothetical protein
MGLIGRSLPHGTIFHRSFWMKASSELFDKKLKILGGSEEENLEGGVHFSLTDRPKDYLNLQLRPAAWPHMEALYINAFQRKKKP